MFFLCFVSDLAIWANPHSQFLRLAGRGTNSTLNCEVCAQPTPTFEWVFEEDTASLSTGGKPHPYQHTGQ